MHKHLKGTFKEKDNTSPHLTTKPYVHNKVEDGSTEQSAATKKKSSRWESYFITASKQTTTARAPWSWTTKQTFAPSAANIFMFSHQRITHWFTPQAAFSKLYVCACMFACAYMCLCACFAPWAPHAYAHILAMRGDSCNRKKRKGCRCWLAWTQQSSNYLCSKSFTEKMFHWPTKSNGGHFGNHT